MLPPPVLDLMRKMLDKSQQTRISAQQALKHEVFESQMDIEEEEPMKEKENKFYGFGSNKVQ